MRTIKTYSKRAPFYNAFIGRLVSDSLPARRPVTTATEKAGQAE
jgi:hypothetical protein